MTAEGLREGGARIRARMDTRDYDDTQETAVAACAALDAKNAELAALRAELASVREDARGLALRRIGVGQAHANSGHRALVCNECHTAGPYNASPYDPTWHAPPCPAARSL